MKKLFPLLILLFLFFSCIPMKQEGFDLIQKDFARYKKDKNLNITIELKNVKVHIVGDRKYFKWDKAAAYGSPVAGYATSKNEIYIFGRLNKKGKIIVNQAILGHELNHLLNFNNSNIAKGEKL